MFDLAPTKRRVHVRLRPGLARAAPERNGYLFADNLLAVHVNYLALETLLCWAARCECSALPAAVTGSSTTGAFPRDELAGVGLNLCLGTDSLASVTKDRGQPLELNLFAEMQAFAARASDVPPEEIVRMVTLHGARALGLEGQNRRAGRRFAGGYHLPFIQRESRRDVRLYRAAPGEVAVSDIDGEWV